MNSMEKNKGWEGIHSGINISEAVDWVLKNYPWSGSRNFVDAIKARGAVNSRSHIMDAGCSSGKIGLALALKTGCRLTCLDKSSSGILLAKEVYRELCRRTGKRLAIDFLEGDIQSLPFIDKFDLVFNEGVIEHWQDRPMRLNAISQMAKSTKPGGKVLIWVPNKRNPFYWFYKKIGYDGPAIQEWLFTPEELRALMVEAGLEGVSVSGFQAYLAPFYVSPILIYRLKPLAVLFWLLGKIMPQKVKMALSLKYSFEILGIGQRPKERVFERSI